MNRARAFTLVETMVAISILLVAITGPLYAVMQAVQAAYIARDQLIASSLAQEGVEYVRHIRDDNFLYNLANPSTPVSWLNGLSNCRASNTCTVDPTGNTPITLCSGACTALYTSATGLYTQAASGNTLTRFTRSVNIIDVSSTEVSVTVTTAWTTNHVNYAVTVNDHLFNWQ